MAQRRRGPVKKASGGRGRGKIARKCSLKDICEFLAELDVWLQAFYQDYRAVRIALCNVEKQAFEGTGSAAKRLCGGGTGDPPPPPQPPKWG